jgi:hypothetical protein
VSLFLLAITAKSQTTLSAISVNGQQYDITYNTGTFDSFETAISTDAGDSRALGGGAIAAPWWTASNSMANSFAQAVYSANNANNNIRFAHKTETIFGTAAVYASTYDGGTDVATNVYAQNASGNYAVSAVAVPAPLPILGILPVVGFLKRMRRRQRA